MRIGNVICAFIELPVYIDILTVRILLGSECQVKDVFQGIWITEFARLSVRFLFPCVEHLRTHIHCQSKL